MWVRVVNGLREQHLQAGSRCHDLLSVMVEFNRVFSEDHFGEDGLRCVFDTTHPALIALGADKVGFHSERAITNPVVRVLPVPVADMATTQSVLPGRVLPHGLTNPGGVEVLFGDTGAIAEDAAFLGQCYT